jgi:hypothetical protein
LADHDLADRLSPLPAQIIALQTILAAVTMPIAMSLAATA